MKKQTKTELMKYYLTLLKKRSILTLFWSVIAGWLGVIYLTNKSFFLLIALFFSVIMAYVSIFTSFIALKKLKKVATKK